MQIQLIRNATMRITYAGHTFLVDPDFAPKESRPSFTGASRNPLVELPLAPQEIITGCEMVVISHLHQDHFDSVARQLLPKDLPVFCQPGDEETISSLGFQQVTPITDSTHWQTIKITRVGGEHGSGAVLADMGKVSGFLFESEQEPSLYWAGDTVLNTEVRETIEQQQPAVVVTHSSGAVWGKGTLIVMDAQQTVEVCQLAPQSTVIAIHLDSLDHGTISRAKMHEVAAAHQVRSSQLLIPRDGETITLNKQ